jgi:hypothetical protein
MRPSWLVNLLSREELDHHRLYVEHGRSVYRVEFGDIQRGALDSDHPTDSAPDAIGPVLASLGEDADCWPFLIVSRVPRTSDRFGRLNLMEEV